MQIEAREMSVPGGGRQHPWRVGIVPHAPHAGARARTERDSPLNRGAADAGQSGRFFDNGIGLEEVGIAGIETATLEEPLHPRGDPREHDADLFIGRRRQGPETERVPIAFGEEDAVAEQLAAAWVVRKKLAAPVAGVEIVRKELGG